jgi:hypothetical protein
VRQADGDRSSCCSYQEVRQLRRRGPYYIQILSIVRKGVVNRRIP